MVVVFGNLCVIEVFELILEMFYENVDVDLIVWYGGIMVLVGVVFDEELLKFFEYYFKYVCFVIVVVMWKWNLLIVLVFLVDLDEVVVVEVVWVIYDLLFVEVMLKLVLMIEWIIENDVLVWRVFNVNFW